LIPQLRPHNDEDEGDNLTITISASIDPIDGEDGVLGQASWTSIGCCVNYTDSLAGVRTVIPYEGFMRFDSADVPRMNASIFGTFLSRLPLASFLRQVSQNLFWHQHLVHNRGAAIIYTPTRSMICSTTTTNLICFLSLAAEDIVMHEMGHVLGLGT
jgi:hypothetical protein